MVQNYRDLKVWQKAMDLADEIFTVTDTFPNQQKFVLVSQMQRSALSIPSNIAEGRSRHSESDFIYHLNIARGSLAELETQILLSARRQYIDELASERLLVLCSEITRMLFGLRDSMKQVKQQKLKPVTCNL